MAVPGFACMVVFLALVSPNYGYPVDEWPNECGNRSYCWIKMNGTYPEEDFNKLLKGVNFTTDLGGGLRNRSSTPEDIADCIPREKYEKIYMIKDSANVTWYVAQTDSFNVLVNFEECQDKSRIYTRVSLNPYQLARHEVRCQEQLVNFGFPVLSRDRTRLETLSPHGGIPFSCNAKIITTSHP